MRDLLEYFSKEEKFTFQLREGPFIISYYSIFLKNKDIEISFPKNLSSNNSLKVEYAIINNFSNDFRLKIFRVDLIYPLTSKIITESDDSQLYDLQLFKKDLDQYAHKILNAFKPNSIKFIMD